MEKIWKLPSLLEQSHFESGSPLQPSLHSQSGWPLTMAWSNWVTAFYQVMFTLHLAFSPQESDWHSSTSSSPAPLPVPSSGDCGDAGVLPGTVKYFSMKVQIYGSFYQRLNISSKHIAPSNVDLPAWPHSRFPDTAFELGFLPLLEVFTQQSLSAGRNVQNLAPSVEKQSFAQASWFSTIEPPFFPFPPTLMLWPK